jgi:hypothetical protein
MGGRVTIPDALSAFATQQTLTLITEMLRNRGG